MLINPFIFASGGGVGTTHRYLRITMTTNQSSDATAFALAQLTCHETVGGADVLAGSGATITASSTTGSNTTANLVDGSDSTFWATGGAGTATFIIDWGAGNGKDICEIGFKGRNDGVYQQTPYEGSVAYSADNSTYTSDWSFPAMMLEQFTSGTTLPLQRIRRTSLFPSGTNRRLWGIKCNASSASFFELAQLELRATSGGANMCTGGKAVSHTLFSTDFSPALAFDGVSSQWASASISRGYLGYDFGNGNEKAKPAQIAIKASAIPSRCPTDFDLWYQDGVGGTITVQQNFTSPATWTSGEVRTFTVT